MPAPCPLDATQMEETLRRLAGELKGLGPEGLVLLGIRSRGLPLAERLGEMLGGQVPVGALDITLYRDDLNESLGSPLVRPTEIPFPLKDRTVVLVDDVLHTGRTIRAALDALLDFGRPKAVRLCVLVDRGGRELPIQADFTGLKLETRPGQRINVRVKEIDGEDSVTLSTSAFGGSAE